MADSTSLSTGTNSGTQTTTQSPQASASAAGFSGAQTSEVQPGTTSSLLSNTTGGIPLGGTQLSTVSLGNASTATVTNASAPKVHHTNPVLFGFALLLFVIAIALFMATSRSAKNTTNY